MYYYPKYEFLHNDDERLYEPTSRFRNLSLERLLHNREYEQQIRRTAPKPLSVGDVRGHSIGLALAGIKPVMPGVEHISILSYAGIVGEEVDCVAQTERRLAVIGGLYVSESSRHHGFGSLTVSGLMRVAWDQSGRETTGHEGYRAYCNEYSAPLFEKLHFTIDGVNDAGKYIATWLQKP